MLVIKEHVNPCAMLHCGMNILGLTDWERNTKKEIHLSEIFHSHFGMHFFVCSIIWNDLSNIDGDRKLGYFLICLYWLRS